MKTPTPRTRRGQILLIALVFMAILLGISGTFISYVLLYAKSELRTVNDQQALALAEAGIDKAVYELNQSSAYTGETNTALGEGTFTTNVTTVDGNTRRVTSTGYIPNSVSPIETKIIKVTVGINNSVISFRYGIQAGDGGFTMSNSSKIFGNVFSSGPVIGNNGNYVYGDAVSSGINGLIYGIHATGTAYAHTIGNASANTIIDKDAYYMTKTNTTVTGTLHPNSPDQHSVPLPISDAQINEWEGYAAAGGTISACDDHGDYTISVSMSLGPKKIACNVVIKSSSGVLTVSGPLWITGNITTQTGPTIKMDQSLGGQNVAVIADNPGNTTGSGIINVGQSTVFQGSGSSGSFVFLISQNNSAETGGATEAIQLNQGASALVVYAAHGLATLSQSVGVKEVTAYKIALSQSANVTYDTGLPNTLFESGPGGSWTVTQGTYSIVK